MKNPANVRYRERETGCKEMQRNAKKWENMEKLASVKCRQNDVKIRQVKVQTKWSELKNKKQDAGCKKVRGTWKTQPM